MFSLIQETFREHAIIVPFLSLSIAISMKGLLSLIRGTFTLERMLWSGWMPSAHSAFVVSLATVMFLKHGFFSDEFLISFVFSIIIIYDALNVRYQAGLHAQLLNEIIVKGELKLNESIGHTPIEALAGTIIWVGISILLLGF